MKNSAPKLNVNDIPALLARSLRKISAYKAFIFFLLVAGLYGFIVWRINTFSNTPAASVSDQVKQSAAQAHIDKTTIQKIQSLEDNSVNVQALFDAARNDPFQE